MYTKHPERANISNDTESMSLCPFLLVISGSFVEQPNAKAMPEVFFCFPLVLPHSI